MSSNSTYKYRRIAKYFGLFSTENQSFSLALTRLGTFAYTSIGYSKRHPLARVPLGGLL
jgi:hypothetical protein